MKWTGPDLRRARSICIVSILLALPLRAGAAEVSIVCGTEGIEVEFCETGARRWAESSGNTVRVIRAEKASASRFRDIEQLLQVQAPDLDVIQIDVVWPGLLADYLLELDNWLPERVNAHLPAIRRLAEVDGHIVAVPWYLNVGRLFYRSDLLLKHGEKVPETWTELEESAARIQSAEREKGNPQMWGFVWQGKLGEALTSNTLEWFAGHGADQFVTPEGTVSVSSSKAVDALRRAAAWVGAISPPNVIELGEDESLEVFNQGLAVYMRHWSSMFDATQVEKSLAKGNTRMQTVPHFADGTPIVGTLGGWLLGVSRYSKSPELAVELVLYLTGLDEQRRRALEGGFSPTISALYDDETLMSERPRLADIRPQLAAGQVRPSRQTGRQYASVSAAIARAVHEVIAGEAEPEPRLDALAQQLNEMSRGGTKW